MAEELKIPQSGLSKKEKYQTLLPQIQSLLEGLRQLVFHAAAVRHGSQVYGAKRARGLLSPTEREIVDSSYDRYDRTIIKELATLYGRLLEELPPLIPVEQSLERFQVSLHELL